MTTFAYHSLQRPAAEERGVCFSPRQYWYTYLGLVMVLIRMQARHHACEEGGRAEGGGLCASAGLRAVT